MGQSGVDNHARILKHGEVFAMLDELGDIAPEDEAQEGVYFNDTRHLSRLRLTINGEKPELLGSHVSLKTGALMVDAAIRETDGTRQHSVHVKRVFFLSATGAHMRVRLENFGTARQQLDTAIEVDADFADIFEARGFRRGARSAVTCAPNGDKGVVFRYHGDDDTSRMTRVETAPVSAKERPLCWRFDLEPGECRTIFLCFAFTNDQIPEDASAGYIPALRKVRRSIRRKHALGPRLRFDNPMTQEVFDRAASDLALLTTELATGHYPFAGVPWFSTPFGRDGLVTALLTLWSHPHLAKGVLTYLADAQSHEDDPSSDAEPGKILHEARNGELARINAVPYRRYYGAIDSTPLFVMLAGAYYRQTNDRDTLERIWPAVQHAVQWMEQHGDSDGDGLLEYARRRPDGLRNQGWKDSDDSVFHDDGRLAEGPIALVEVQGYAFAAYNAAAELAEALGKAAPVEHWRARAGDIAAKVDSLFWDDALGCYGLALDGEKRLCRVRTSNAGHLLFCGLPPKARAARLVELLLSPRFFTGYGIRTVATGEARYNPMSYHNGSVWPHDTALIAMGLARYGFHEAVAKLFDGLLDAAEHMDLRRLPELFCGFRKAPYAPPVTYPVACAPQAWAAASVFGLLDASLGISMVTGTWRQRNDKATLPKRLGSPAPLVQPPERAGRRP